MWRAAALAAVVFHAAVQFPFEQAVFLAQMPW